MMMMMIMKTKMMIVWHVVWKHLALVEWRDNAFDGVKVGSCDLILKFGLKYWWWVVIVIIH